MSRPARAINLTADSEQEEEEELPSYGLSGGGKGAFKRLRTSSGGACASDDGAAGAVKVWEHAAARRARVGSVWCGVQC